MRNFMRILSCDDTAHSQLAWSGLRPLDVVSCKEMIVSFAGTENIRSFTVDHVVTCEELGFGHAKRNTADVFDEEKDEGGPDRIPADDE
jgi:hypothetical protein